MTTNTIAHIALNKDVFNLLFPEGSEARVELTKSAVAELIKNQIRPTALSEEIREFIQQQVEECKQHVLHNLGVGKYDWSGSKFQLSQQLSESIKLCVESALCQTIATAVANEKASIWLQVKQAVASKIKPMVDFELQQQVNTAVNAAVVAAVSAVLQLRTDSK